LTSDFQPDVEAILNAAGPQSKILFLCSPNNPTGNAFHPQILRQLAKAFPGIVVVDEAYIDFSEDPGALPLLPEFPNLVVLQTFSKAWGLAAIRLGMAFAGEPIIHLLNKVKAPYNLNLLSQEKALQAIRDPGHKQQMVQVLLEERKRLANALSAFPFVRQIFPSDANFLLVRVDAPGKLYDFLTRHGIIVRNRSSVLLCEGCLRISIGTPDENAVLLQALNIFTSAGQP
jgi:histidinol-phosphate aminotransferase